MIKLNDDSIYVGQIKQILHNFNLPMFNLYEEGSTYALGEHYLKDGAIYGHVNVYDDEGNFLYEDYNKFIKYYKFGKFIEGLTTRLPISSNLYDSQTHEYLGNYLRFLKYYLDIDLMSLYNCCGYDSPRDFEAKVRINDTIVSSFESDNPRYTLIMVPVKWGRKYTIGIDYHGDIEMACVHFDDNIILDPIDSGLNEHLMLSNTYKKQKGTRFNHPFVYDNLMFRKHDGDLLENKLKLIIKIPTSCKSSIVVLEGDYVKCSNSNMYMDNYEQKLGDTLYYYLVDSDDPNPSEEDGKKHPIWNFDYVNKNQLLSLNLGTKSLLADRLVEYLSQQAIAPNDDVVDNIKRLQRTLVEKCTSYFIKQYGVWDDSMRQTIYSYLWNRGLIHKYQDMLSYFDKDIETKIGGLLTKYNDLDPKKKTFTYGEVGGK